MKRKIKCLIIGIKCLFGHHTEDPYVHIIYGNKKIVDALKLLRSQLDFGMFYPVQYAAIAALTGLGYQRPQIMSALSGVDTKGLTAEEIIRAAFKKLVKI